MEGLLNITTLLSTQGADVFLPSRFLFDLDRMSFG